MKRIKWLFIIIAACIVSCSTAQTFQVIKATRQGYAGGVAGNSGVGYNIELTTRSRAAVPDTVWINGHCYPLDFKTKQGNMIRKIDSVTHQITYTISVGESHTQFNRRLSPEKNDSAAGKTQPTHSFEGAALISYATGHKRHIFIVKSFTVLSQINYP